MPVLDYRSCNALLRKCTADHRHSESLALFRWLQSNRGRPDCVALAAAIKSSAALCVDGFGRSLHGFAEKAGNLKNAPVEKALMDMYGRLGRTYLSRQVFDEMGWRDTVAWNIMLTGFARVGLHEDAVDLFCSMHSSGLEESKPTVVTFAVIIPICAKLKLMKAGLSIHGYVVKVGLESDTLAGNALISMYAKCDGLMDSAYKVFDLIKCKDVVSWNSIITGYSENGFFEDAFLLLSHMTSRGFLLNYATVAIVLPICAFVEEGKYHGKGVHGHIVRFGLEEDLSVCNALLTHYSKVGDMKVVELISEKMDSMDIVTWNAVISGYATLGCYSKALALYHELLSMGADPDSVTLISILPVCAQLNDVKEGRRIHAYILRHPILLHDTSLQNALTSFYGQCGMSNDAFNTFKGIQNRDLISWNAILSAYADNEECQKFYDLVNKMIHEGIRPDHVTVLSALLISSLSGHEAIREAHGYSFRLGLTSEAAVTNAIIHSYAKCGDINNAYKVFRSSTRKNIVTGNTMISGYLKHGSDRGEEAKVIFSQMPERDLATWNLMLLVYAQNDCIDQAFSLLHQLQLEGIKPDAVTITSALSACTRLASVDLVRQCHGYAVRAYLEDIHLEGALLDAYSKCGVIRDAYNLFGASQKKDLVTFTSMIGCYTVHGMVGEAIELFSRMLELNIKPDHVIMTALLSACCHAGLVDEGRRLFKSIREIHGVEPTMENYACMVDLLARRGWLQEAYEFILNMPYEANPSVWGSLLGACKIYGDVDIGQLAAEHLFDIEIDNIGNYVVMSNIYAANERWDGVEQVRRLMKSKDLMKPAGCSWIEVKKIRHSFVADDLCHPDRYFIYNMLKNLDQQIREPVSQRNT